MTNLKKIKAIQNGKIFRVADTVIYVALVLAVALFFLAFTGGKEGKSAEICDEFGVVKSISLTENKTYTVYPVSNGERARVVEGLETTERPHLTVVVEDGTVRVGENNFCPDRLCVRQGKKSKSGQLITCLPFKIYVRVKSAAPLKEDDRYPLQVRADDRKNGGLL